MDALGIEGRPPLHGRESLSAGRDGIVASRYSSVADDSSQGGTKREAAMLLSVAEGQLSEEMLGECMQAATQALGLFRQLGDQTGVADTVSVMISCQKLEAELENKVPSAALRMATEEMANFTKIGNKRGEACMSLAFADLYSSMKRGKQDLSKAMSFVKESLNTFKAIGDKKLEAAANVVLTTIYFQKKQPEQAMTMAGEALKLYKSLADKKGEVKALHVKALAYAMVNDYDNAISTGKASLALVKEIGDKGSIVSEMKSLVSILLDAGKTGAAVPLAQEALTTAKSIGVSKKVEANALLTVCQTLAAAGNGRKAVKLAKAGLASAKEAGDQAGISAMYEVLLFAHLQGDRLSEATLAAEEAITAGKEMGDKELELNMLHQVCKVQMRAQEWNAAVKTMRDAATLAQDLNDIEGEADALLSLCGVHIQRIDVKGDKGALAEAMTAAEDCRALYKTAGFLTGEAQAVMSMACLKSLNEDSGEVLPLAKEARELYKSAGDEFGECVSLRLILESYLVEENMEAALEHANALVDIQKSIGQKKKQAEAMVKVAQIYFAKMDTQTALQVAGEAQGLAKEASDFGVEAEAALLSALINLRLMESEEMPEDPKALPPPGYLDAKEKASKAIKESMLLASKAGSEVLRGSALLARAQMAAASAREKEALRAGMEADKIFGKVSEFSKQVNAKILLANLYFGMKEQSKAAAMAKEALEIARKYQDDYMDEANAQAALDKIEGVTRKAVPMEMAAVADAPAGGAGGGAVAKPALDKKVVADKVLELVNDAAASGDDIDADTPLMDAGVDSLASVQLVNSISTEFGITLAPSAVFDYPTMATLVEHVIEEASS